MEINLLSKSKFKTLGLVAIPALLAIFALINFQQSKSEITTSLSTQEDGLVAGVSQTGVTDLTNDIPIFPESEIASFTTTNNSAFVTLETNKPEAEIVAYYEDYLLLNNWVNKDGKYFKDEKILDINISEGIIKITLTR